MPRAPRLDWPGALHHIIARGIERRKIFYSDRDRRDLLCRLEKAIATSGAKLYAWCFMPNHFHLLVRTGEVSVSRFVQRWLGGYVTCFNLRHHRSGHLFQNRFKSVLVEEEGYLLELVRYIHLNPVRSRLPVSIDSLDRYPWTGHAALLGEEGISGQEVEFVLLQFGNAPREARQNYRRFVREGALRKEPDLEGGGLRRSAGGWEHVVRISRGRERWAHDERILGSSDFVREVIESHRLDLPPPSKKTSHELLADLCTQVASTNGLTATELGGRSCRRAVLEARSAICAAAVRQYGLSLAEVGRHLGLSIQSVARAIARAKKPPAAS